MYLAVSKLLLALLWTTTALGLPQVPKFIRPHSEQKPSTPNTPSPKSSPGTETSPRTQGTPVTPENPSPPKAQSNPNTPRTRAEASPDSKVGPAEIIIGSLPGFLLGAAVDRVLIERGRRSRTSGNQAQTPKQPQTVPGNYQNRRFFVRPGPPVPPVKGQKQQSSAELSQKGSLVRQPQAQPPVGASKGEAVNTPAVPVDQNWRSNLRPGERIKAGQDYRNKVKEKGVNWIEFETCLSEKAQKQWPNYLGGFLSLLEAYFSKGDLGETREEHEARKYLLDSFATGCLSEILGESKPAEGDKKADPNTSNPFSLNSPKGSLRIPDGVGEAATVLGGTAGLYGLRNQGYKILEGAMRRLTGGYTSPF